MSRILVTGASGFIGRSLVKLLVEGKHHVRATYLGNKPVIEYGQDGHITWTRYDLGHEYDYSKLLAGIDFIVHLAGQAHVQKPTSATAGSSFDKINAEGTGILAQAAGRSGVRRFIYLSTVKVHGDATTKSSDGQYQRFSEDDRPNPQNAYATSKLAGELVLQNVCQSSGLEYVILRPPLVYGPHVKANFLRLIHLVAKGLPLPFASIHNLRSLLYVENLGHAIMTCSIRLEASNQIYLVSDVDVSLADLINKIALFLGRKAVLFPCYGSLLKLGGVLTGRTDIINRLTESLLVDNSKMARELGWKPPFSFDEGLKRTIDWYRMSYAK